VLFRSKNETGKVLADGFHPDEISFWIALKEPMVWLFGLIMGVACSIEACSVAWSGLYYQDVFGMEIGSEGAAFLSAFFVFYTLSRFFGGFFAEKIGLIKIIITASIAIPILLAASFFLGRPGVYLLPVSGIFVALVYPSILAVSIGVFKEKAQAMSPAIISIAFVLNGIAQYGFGLSNRFIGPAWAYRSCIVYGVLLLLLTLRLGKLLKTIPEVPARTASSRPS
jgi:fucose permease